MKALRKSPLLKIVASFLVVTLLAELGSPALSWALTEGPVQPEFTSFEPVSTTNMVNDFSGDFTYNLPVVDIPGPHGSGYALSLSYHSGTNPEQESTWCGYGWNLNPGTINRSKKGFADDIKNKPVTYVHKMRNNRTITAQGSASGDLLSNPNFGVNVGLGLRYNNMRGFGLLANSGLSFFDGIMNVGLSVSQDGHSFSASVNPMNIIVHQLAKTSRKEKSLIDKAGERKNSNKQERKNKIDAEYNKKSRPFKWLSGGSSYSLNNFSDEFNVSVAPTFRGTSTTLQFGTQANWNIVDGGVRLNVLGTYSEQHTPNDEIERDILCYGYQYLHEAPQNSTELKRMDFSVERDAGFNGRDLFLGVPYSGADNFSVTGEGLSGGFKMHRKHIGTFYPDKSKSSTVLASAGVDVGTGLANVIGASGSGGSQVTELKGWRNGDVGDAMDKTFENQQWDEYFFRFTNDMAGNVLTTQDLDAIPKAQIKRSAYHVDEPGLFRMKSGIDFNTDLMDAELGNSSTIAYSLNTDFSESVLDMEGSVKNFKVHERSAALGVGVQNTSIDRQEDEVKDGVGEFATVDEAGFSHVYGLPVYSSSETSMSLSLHNGGPYSGAVDNNSKVYLDYKWDSSPKWEELDDDFKSFSGQVNDNPYASSYLLTQITSPDYIDRTFDGPSADDFGGWTTFDYRQAWGERSKANSDSWYSWRQPYYGLNLERGDLATQLDDFGSFASGKHEIYYLKKIETKTHVAFFVTNTTTETDFGFSQEDGVSIYLSGSGIQRTEGFPPKADHIVSDQMDPDTDDYIDHAKPLERLEKIVLFAKNEEGELLGRPLKTTFLEYYDESQMDELDQIAWQGLPNSWNPSFAGVGEHGGKLMLKRVWFEYDGVQHSKIRPYTFKYTYKALDPTSDYGIKYPEIASFGNGLNEAPTYSEYITDAWGSYRDISTAESRGFDKMDWVDQSTIPAESTFDPAAWQLKQIKLPSGGEILVQYEQKDYAFVQDKRALAMVSLDESAPNSSTDIYLNLDDLGLENASEEELTNYLALLNEYLGEQGEKEKVYFKFLYKLVSSGINEPNIEGECGSQYISGYAKAKALRSGNRIYLQLQGSYLPHKVCLDFLKRNMGNPQIATNCGELTEFSTNPRQAVEAVFQQLGQTNLDFPEAGFCTHRNEALSYLRVPVFHAKKGGGIRVKRILMFDEGLESGDEVLYGTEYLYQTVEGKSSGVATNEPASIREENPLVRHLRDRDDQKKIDKIISGRDKEEGEGPIGEMALPGPSVGYSRVVMHNIHSGKTGTGHIVNEYYTVKDFPNTVEFTTMRKIRDYALIPLGLFNGVIDNRWATQGYLFKNYNMHGRLKRTSTYGGGYVNSDDPDKARFLSSQQEMIYFDPEEKVPVLEEDGTVVMKYMGIEEDLAMYMKGVEEKYDNLDLAVDFSLSNTWPLPFPGFSLWPSYNLQESRIRTHVTSRMLSFSPVLKKTITYSDGIYAQQENKVFSGTTGAPIITSSQDSYHLNLEEHGVDRDAYYVNYSIPGTHVYRDLGSKSKNQGFKLGGQNISFTGYRFSLQTTELIESGMLIPGDLIKLSDGSAEEIYYIDHFEGAEVHLARLDMMPSKDLNTIQEIEVLHSGYRNQLKTVVASMTTYGEDYDGQLLPSPVSNGVISNLSNVVAAQVSTLSDEWGDNYSLDLYNVEGSGGFQNGSRGKWRQKESYVYRTDVTGSTGSGEFNYSGGIYTNFVGFDFNDPPSNPSEWLKTTEMLSYSPHGEPLEEQNSLGIKSAVKFGYSNHVPVLIASNASNGAVLFESFEKPELFDPTESHAGKQSLFLGIAGSYESDKLLLDDQIQDEGLLVEFWFKPGTGYPGINDDHGLRVNLEETLGGEIQNVVRGAAYKVSQVGEWFLYRCEFAGAAFLQESGSDFRISVKNYHLAGAWVDDLRVQPMDSEMITYVYDADDLKLLVSFDDQHFGTYFQYNTEGQLVRKSIETERGKKSLQENYYNTPWTNKD